MRTRTRIAANLIMMLALSIPFLTNTEPPQAGSSACKDDMKALLQQILDENAQLNKNEQLAKKALLLAALPNCVVCANKCFPQIKTTCCDGYMHEGCYFKYLTSNDGRTCPCTE